MRFLVHLRGQRLKTQWKKIGISGGDIATQKAKPKGAYSGENYRENMALMTKALREREDQIEELQEKVAQASRWVNAFT